MSSKYDNEFKTHLDNIESTIEDYTNELNRLIRERDKLDVEYKNYRLKLFKNKTRLKEYKNIISNLDDRILRLSETRTHLESNLLSQRILSKISRSIEIMNTNIYLINSREK